MKKKVLSLLLTLVMLVSLLPAAVFAEGPDAPDAQPQAVEETVQETAEEAAPAEEPAPAEAAPAEEIGVVSAVPVPEPQTARSAYGPDNDDLFMGYIYQISGLDPKEAVMPEPESPKDPNAVYYPVAYRQALSANNQAIYNSLAAQLKALASYSGTQPQLTRFFAPWGAPRQIPVAEIEAMYNDVTTQVNTGSGYTTWHQLCVDSGYNSAEEAKEYLAFQKMAKDYNGYTSGYDWTSISNCLIYDLPYDLFWFDKSGGGSAAQVYTKVDTAGDTYTCYYGVWAIFYVAQPFQCQGYNVYVDPSAITLAKEAATNAAAIVAANAGASDSNKLRAYAEAIEARTSYNWDVLNTPSTPYGHPWQLIYVFDNDTGNKVVCEGYAKAFKYLCDLTSTWQDENFSCILVTGNMDGGTGAGAHMWNIVRLGGDNYLVDITNCDEGSIGASFDSTPVGMLYMRERQAGTYATAYTFDYDLPQGYTPAHATIAYTYDTDTTALYSAAELALKGDPELGHAVHFDLNGHGTTAVPDSQNVANEGKVTKPADPVDNTNTAWKFAGWCKEAACTNVWNFDSDTVTSATTLYAKWEKKHQVVFDKGDDDATGTMEPLVFDGDTHALTANAFAYTNHRFVGWATEPGGDVVYADGASVTMGDTYSMTLYAKWEEHYSGLRVHVTNGVGQYGITVTQPSEYNGNTGIVPVSGGNFFFTAMVDGQAYSILFEMEGYVSHVITGTYQASDQDGVQITLAKMGDVNGDGAIDIQDMACLFTFLSGGGRTGNLISDTDYFDKVADFNGDGTIDILDYQAVYQRINHPGSAMKVV